MHREIARVCRTRGLAVPSRGTLTSRIARLDPLKARTAREGKDAARVLRSAGGVVPPITRMLQQVQIDHTVVDVIVVDEQHRRPTGRPYVTAAIGLAPWLRAARIQLDYRPPGEPHYGEIVERVIGTMMQMVHELPGATFSNPNPTQRGA